jgi:hypothetical protein
LSAAEARVQELENQLRQKERTAISLAQVGTLPQIPKGATILVVDAGADGVDASSRPRSELAISVDRLMRDQRRRILNLPRKRQKKDKDEQSESGSIVQGRQSEDTRSTLASTTAQGVLRVLYDQTKSEDGVEAKILEALEKAGLALLGWCIDRWQLSFIK